MATILVAYASKHGSTREIAEVIAEQLRLAHLTVDLRDVAELKGVNGYDAVILGSAIYAGNWLSEAKRFAERHRAALSRLPLWLFSSGPLGDDPKPHEDPKKLAESLGPVFVRDHRVFVGKLDEDTVGLGERLIMKAVRAPYGDFRDWDAIHNWAQDIARELVVEFGVKS